GRYERWQELLKYALAAAPRQSAPWATLEILDSLHDIEEERFHLGYQRQYAAVAVLRQHGSPYKLGWGLLHLGVSAFALDRPKEAARLTKGALGEFKRSDRHGLLGRTYYHLFWQSIEPKEHERWFKQYID